MGGSSWSDDFYTARTTTRAKKGVDAFTYSRTVTSKPIAEQKVHEKMDPKGVIRESRDSDAHPESNAIAVMFDVTGSMHQVPMELQKKLPELMGLLLRKGYIEHPQVLFGCIGDFYSDRAPLQVGQFESGIEMDDTFEHMWLERGGGGSYEESYQEALYFFANKTSIDCFEKRNKKGYLFMIGDEHPYKTATREELEAVIGDTVQENIPVQELVRQVQEKYNLFFIIPTHTIHGRDPKLKEYWQELIGPQNVLVLEDTNNVCEAIGTTIGVMEGTMDFDRIGDELDHVDAAVVKDVAKAIDPLAKSLTKFGEGTLPPTTTGDETTERL